MAQQEQTNPDKHPSEEFGSKENSDTKPQNKDTHTDSNDTANDKPIPGPTSVGPEFAWEPDPYISMSMAGAITKGVLDLFRKPAHWIHENVVLPNKGPKYYWYHRQYGRALPIDECYFDDYACITEANIEYGRNLRVDRATIELLRYRRDSCDYWYTTKQNRMYFSENCDGIRETYKREELNFFIKYGELHHKSGAFAAYNKQKHRMIMERRRALREQTEPPAEAR